MSWNFRGVAACCAAAALFASPAFAVDRTVATMMRTFSSACLPNAGNPDVGAWAKAHGLTELHDAESLMVFEGIGDLGAAWTVSTKEGTFALAVRGRTQGCARRLRTSRAVSEQPPPPASRRPRKVACRLSSSASA